VEAWISYIYQSLEALTLGLRQDAAPWLLLLILLIAGLLALREIVLARKAISVRDDRHLVNMTRFRGELAKRQALESRPQIGYWS
jgi:hypothetical protein